MKTIMLMKNVTYNSLKLINIFIVCVIVTAMLSISGCDNSMKGVYIDQKNNVKVTLKSDGTAYVYSEIMGLSNERVGTYKVDDKKFLLTIDGKTQVFNIQDDGSFSSAGLFGLHLKKLGESRINDTSAQTQKAQQHQTEDGVRKGAQGILAGAMSQTSLAYSKSLLENGGGKVRMVEIIRGCQNTQFSGDYKIECVKSGSDVIITVTHSDFQNVNESDTWKNPASM